MSRQKKKADYNSENIMKEYIDSLADAYGTPYDDREQPVEDHISLNEVVPRT